MRSIGQYIVYDKAKVYARYLVSYPAAVTDKKTSVRFDHPFFVIGIVAPP